MKQKSNGFMGNISHQSYSEAFSIHLMDMVIGNLTEMAVNTDATEKKVFLLF